ncbi:hypothetical protein DMUE_5493, partial [Dictyocoela muelleri]
MFNDRIDGEEENENPRRITQCIFNSEITITEGYKKNKFPGKRLQVSDDDRERIVTRTLEGRSVKEISDMYKLGYKTVYGIVQRYLKHGLVMPLRRSGDIRSLLSSEKKEKLLARVDQECTLTLSQLSDWVYETFQIKVSKNTVERVLKQFHYTLKRITLIPERRNCDVTIDLRAIYSFTFRSLKIENDDKNFIFFDEVGFSVVSRPSKGRSKSGDSAYVSVPASRSRNISIIAAMNKYGMIFHKIHERAVNGEDFKASLREIKEACVLSDISISIFIIDNARIHHYKGLRDDEEISSFNIVYLPPYSPFLNPIENIFSVW